jgi:hypothetical protein
MGLTESAGFKPATHWNSATSNTGTLSSVGALSQLVAADGSTATGASVTWNAPIATGETSATYTVPFADTSSDAHMMNGYLDPRANASPATINVTLPSGIGGAYDVYVYCYGNIDSRTRTYQYSIGATTHAVTQTGPSVTTFPAHTPAPTGGTGAGTYVLFQNVTGTTFTLTATPPVAAGSQRSPVNGIQIVYPAGS